LSEGGPAAIVFAATRPRRTRALILSSTFSYTGVVGWDEVNGDPAELRAHVLPELGDDYTPSVDQIIRLQEFARSVNSAWGSGVALRRSDRAVEVMARRTPWMLRGMARLTGSQVTARNR